MTVSAVLMVLGVLLVFISAIWQPAAGPPWRPSLFPLGVGFFMVGHLLSAGLLK